MGAGLLIVLFVGWVGFRAYQAYQHLNNAADLVAQIQSHVNNAADLDPKTISPLVSRLQQESAAAQDDVHDPLYRAASHLPWVGDNFSAVATVSDTVQSVSVDAVPTLLQAARIVQPSALAPRGGRIDLGPIVTVASSLQRADGSLLRARQKLAAVDTRHLISPVVSAIQTLSTKLDQASRVTATAARIGRLVPPMMGADGARQYLVVFQNLAETRATGGIFGSYALVRVDHGSVSIVDQGSSSRTIKTFPEPVVRVDSSLTNLYTERLVTSPVDVNFTPDFPTAASTFAAMYAQRTAVEVDGVIAIDPVVLGYLLTGHPPIPIGQGLTLTSANVTKILLSTVYSMFPQNADVPARDAFLDAATSAGFSALMTGGGDARAEIKGLVTGAGQRRVLIWSSHTAEESDLATTTLAGTVPLGDAANPVVGVFLNDGTGGKLDYYLSGSTLVQANECAGQARGLTVTITLKYSAPTSGLPPYVIGLAGAGVPGVLRTNVMVVTPTGGTVGATTVDGKKAPAAVGTDHGRTVGVTTVDMKPGQTIPVVFQVTAPSPGVEPGADVRPSVVVTPGVNKWPVDARVYPACRP